MRKFAPKPKYSNCTFKLWAGEMASLYEPGVEECPGEPREVWVIFLLGGKTLAYRSLCSRINQSIAASYFLCGHDVLHSFQAKSRNPMLYNIQDTPQVFSVIYGYGPLLPFPPKVIGSSRKQGWRQVCSRVTQLHSGSQEQPTRVLTPLSVKRPSRSKQQGFRFTSPEIMVGVEKFRFPISASGFRTSPTSRNLYMQHRKWELRINTTPFPVL